MSDNTTLIDSYYAVRKGTFGFLERIELAQIVDPARWNGFQLTVVLRSEADASSSALRMTFSGVRDIRIGELCGLLRYMLEVRCIEGSQMERSRFKITESEYDAFSFVCEAFAFGEEKGISPNNC
jgi:hypothetical protein